VDDLIQVETDLQTQIGMLNAEVSNEKKNNAIQRDQMIDLVQSNLDKDSNIEQLNQTIQLTQAEHESKLVEITAEAESKVNSTQEKLDTCVA